MDIYQNNFNTVNQTQLDFATLQNNVLLIVNTASQCGWTWHYGELEKLYQRYKSLGLIVIAFPSNDFGEQEPGSNQEIAQFCSNNYNITFPVIEKTSVVGDNQNPLYYRLSKITGREPGWNFGKYLIGKNASSVKFFDQTVDPTDPAFIQEIETLLT